MLNIFLPAKTGKKILLTYKYKGAIPTLPIAQQSRQGFPCTRMMIDKHFIGWKTLNWENNEELHIAYVDKQHNDISVKINKYNNLITINASYSFKQIFYFPFNNDFSDWYQSFNTVEQAKAFVEEKLLAKGYKMLDESYLAYA